MRIILLKQQFNSKAWEERLISALGALASTQEPFLKAHWETNGFPTTYSFNGRDETPFPTDVHYDLYEAALHPERSGNTEYLKPLSASLSSVRGVLRSHPSLSRALGLTIGVDDFQIGILNGSSWTSLSYLIVGQMARRDALSEKSFTKPVAELNSLLQLSNGTCSSPLPSDLDRGFDVELFHRVYIQNYVDLGEGYLLMPYSQLSDYIDSEWLEDIAPDQVHHRDFRFVCAIVHSFRWNPEIHPRNSESKRRVRTPPPLFRRYAAEFMSLLAVSQGKPITWVMTLEGCVSRYASCLLGKIHSKGSTRKHRSIGHLFDPFNKEQATDRQIIEEARGLFAKRRDTSYPELAPVIHRLAEALGRDGQYAAEDKVLDLAVVFERLFKTSGRGISLNLQNAVADALGHDDESKNRLRKAMKHFYDVRSAVVHGPTDEKKRRLRMELKTAYRNGFEMARNSLLKELE